VAHLASLPENLRRIRLFFVSYFPLWVMLALRALPPRHAFQHWSLRTLAVVIFAVLALLSLVDGIRLIRGAQRTTPLTLYLGEIDSQGGNAAAYLATYLLPFLGIVPADLGDWLAYGVYLLVAIVVFINTDLALVNPTLYLMGRKIVSATAYLTEERSQEHRLSAAPVIIICKRPARLSDGSIDVASLAGCYVTKREPAE
jgi:hypothetical protein